MNKRLSAVLLTFVSFGAYAQDDSGDMLLRVKRAFADAALRIAVTRQACRGHPTPAKPVPLRLT